MNEAQRNVGPSISPIENKTVTKGEPILLLCNATGDPAPNVSWSKASGTINPSYVSGKELWILSAKLSDAGKYICTAKNDVSMTTVEAFVTVMLRPHSPVPLSTQITHLTINVYWKKPKSHGYPVLMYSVHRVELDQAGQEVTSRTYHVNEDVHHYEAGDIESGKTYKFYVTAWNTHGESVKDHRKSVTVKVQKP
ncbi:hemicentin-2-like [Actinia tenebrosa]|uniref:Hemicentin-2-like n=1 Tax=Actinia tenebrosa TaxID=6105 RepID=A0A6P8J9T6_ACTTE|nr:hemicentin-2-like [Actinia tenebrosa]